MVEDVDLASQRDRLQSSRFVSLSARPALDAVSRMVIVPFVSGQCVLVRLPSGELSVPEWRSGMGRNYLRGAYLTPLEQAGVRFQQFHPFARKADDRRIIVGWVDGDLRATEVERIVETPETAIALLEVAGNRTLADLVRWATESFRNQTDESYHEDVHILLEESYLAATDVYGGSGFGGGAAHWRVARDLIADAVHKDGAFLDIGCANGLLMESVVAWAAERGHQLEPFGVDISAGLADVARERLPQWTDQIYVGNIMDWTPPRKFDFVSTDLGYVPEGRRRQLVERLLADFMLEGGRLIATSYGLTVDPAKENWSVGDHLRAWGFAVGGEPERYDAVEDRVRRIAFIDNA